MTSLALALVLLQSMTTHTMQEFDVNVTPVTWAKVATYYQQRHMALSLRITSSDGLCLAEELDIDKKIISTQNCAGTVETVDPEWKNSIIPCKSAILHAMHPHTTLAEMRKVDRECQPRSH